MVVIRLCCLSPAYLSKLSLICDFCPSDQGFAYSFLQIPPHDGHPCLRLYPSHHRADSGLAPVRNVRRRAHHTKGHYQYLTAQIGNGLFRSVNLQKNLYGDKLLLRGKSRLIPYILSLSDEFVKSIMALMVYSPLDQ